MTNQTALKVTVIPAKKTFLMAVRRGMEVTIDTIDCPRELMQTVPMDYSHLNLPRPKYGFPWEK